MAGADAFCCRKHRRDEPHQLLPSAGEASPSKKSKPWWTEQAPGTGNAAAGDDGHLGMPTGLGQRIADGARVRRERAAAPSRRCHASAAPAEGSMDSKYPVASKMMAAMGYKPGSGLGKEGQGIVAPIEGVSRPAHAGLGSVQEPRPFLCGKENLPPPPVPAAAPGLERPRWSKKAGARKCPVLTKNALLATRAEEEEQPMVVQKVIDMRSPHARVLTDLRRLNDDEQEMEVDGDVPMPELQYNIRVLVDEAAVDIRSLDAHLRQERENAASLTRDRETFAEHEASHAHQLQVMEVIAGALEQVQVDEAAGVLTLGALLETVRELKTRHEAEFGLCGVAWIACEFARPLLVSAFYGWQPLRDPSFGLDPMTQWKDLLQQQPCGFIPDADGTDPYTQLVHEVILPAVRASGTNSWDARDPEPMLRLLESWERLLPAAVLELILEDVIMPKLSAAVDSWDPEIVPIHVWVHPWLPILGKVRTEALCHSVRYKLVTGVLSRWQTHEASAVLSPWKEVFDPKSWEDMMARYIVPKLKLALQELQISPVIDCQELEQFKDQVMIWASAIPGSHMVHLLEVEFFDKWLWVLCRWLHSPDPDFDEVAEWYKSWRCIFPPELLATDRIRMLLAAGLVMMNNAAQGHEVLPHAARATVGYPEAAENQQFDTAHQASQQVPREAMEDLSFKDCILAYAEEHGLKFMPRVGKLYNDIPVYEFGIVRVCVDSVKRLLYAQIQGSWSAVNLVQLMEMNRMARPC